MKVLALVTDGFGGHGGIAQFNQDFLTAVAALPQIESIRVMPRIGPLSSPRLPPKLSQSGPLFNRYAYAARALTHCAKLRPDVIFNGHVYQGPLAQVLASLSGAKLISQLHGREVWDRLPPRQLRALQRSGLVLCVSHDTMTRYRSQFAADPTNAALLHNTVSARFVVGNRERAREILGFSNEFVILSVGRLDAREGYKGQDRIISLLPRLRCGGRKLVYLIAGAGDDRGRLESIVREFQMDEDVRFLGKVPENELPDLYAAADLFALPSTGEGFGIVFLEAMASGTPAIGLRVGGATDALIHPKFAIAVEPDELGPALQTMIDRAAAMSAADRARLAEMTHQRFGTAAFGARVSELFDHMLPIQSATRSPMDH